ncbi:hypothetical protein EMCG_03742 [[Emmonsia] crescens]|uniref:Uncharacterized protein n=1 Tax=[Emmonsia] crescens TaxID=73230 RepID=A0A0G2HUH4_9EURO|nr:hypothetical protein EMCG_03742 [Emmonsia crescens UAMH 3008]
MGSVWLPFMIETLHGRSSVLRGVIAADGRDIVQVTGTKIDASNLCESKFNFHEYSAPCARIPEGKVNQALKFSILHLLGQHYQSVRAPTSPRNNWY